MAHWHSKKERKKERQLVENVPEEAQELKLLDKVLNQLLMYPSSSRKPWTKVKSHEIGQQYRDRNYIFKKVPKIILLKCIKTEMKISLKGLNSTFEEAEELVNVKISQLSRWGKKWR